MPSVVYYSDGRLSPYLAHAALANLSYLCDSYDMKLVIQKGRQEPRSHITLYENLLAGLDRADDGLVFLAEHDVLYSPSHFATRADLPGPVLAYDLAVLTLCRRAGGFFDAAASGYPALLLSQLSGGKQLLQDAIARQLRDAQAGPVLVAEPTEGVLTYSGDIPSLDVRHSLAFTGYRSPRTAVTLHHPYWGSAAALFSSLKF
jgi:hypothetical protein